VDDPTHEENPGDAGSDEKQNRREDPPLDELTQTRKEKAAKGRNHIPAGSLTS
jgi:hypothetical protein